MIGLLLWLVFVWLVLSWLTGSGLIAFALTGAYVCFRLVRGVRLRRRAEREAAAILREHVREHGWPYL